MTWDNDESWDLSSSVGATATMVAAGRAMATKDPRGLINDPFAELLVEAVGLDFFTNQVKGELDVSAMDAPALAYVRLLVDGIAVRTRYFDQYFLDAVDTGIRQVVILASGLDARAYRLAWPATTVVYEIDQPQVIAFKTATLTDLGAQPTAEHRTVPIDLRDNWPAALRGAGLDTNARTAWSAEGLLQYLPPDAQDLLLDNVAALSAAGSTIAADYNLPIEDSSQATRGEVDRTWRDKGFTLDIASLMATGERSDAAEYLAEHGWQVRRRPVDELFASYDIERIRTDADHPLDNTVYVSGTLGRSTASTD